MFTVTITWRWLAVAAALFALLVGAYLLTRGGKKETPAAADVRATVNDFATSSDADACDLLSDAALQRVYGGKARCITKSAKFQGGAIRIQKVNAAPRRASVKAESLDGKTLYTVKLEKARAGCGTPHGWQISDVASQVK
jgi:hypothetical protein